MPIEERRVSTEGPPSGDGPIGSAAPLMSGGPRYSIASCVVETAHRLIATPGDDPSVAEARQVGRALLTAEVNGFSRLGKGEEKRRYGQGLVLELGFYRDHDLDVVSRNREVVEDELSDSIGGWGAAVQIRPEKLTHTGWLGAGLEWPNDTPYEHLDAWVVHEERRGLLQVIGRRLRYRLGVDHSNGSPDLFWWTTPQTEYWIERYLQPDTPATPITEWRRPDWVGRRAFNGSVGSLYRAKHPDAVINVDGCANSADDWGYVDLDRDPVSVLALGPMSGGQTRSDVEITLRRAGARLQVRHEGVGRDTPPAGENYALALEALLSRTDLDCGVILVYRGGFSGSNTPAAGVCERIIDAAERLASERGVEVVLGLGHGTTDIHALAGRTAAVGVHEAVTPTAAANWILMEHVNQRLMNSRPDLGQSTR